VLRFAWSGIIVFAAWSGAVTYLYQTLRDEGIDCSIPIAPLTTIGVAVAFYIGFKNDQSYDRNWEGRKIWGGIVNVSRSFANDVLSFVSSHHAQDVIDPVSVSETHRALIYRHLAWMHALRFQLRRKTPFGFTPRGSQLRFAQATDLDAMRQQLCQLLPQRELTVVCSQVNSATQILRLQSDHLKRIYEDDQLIDNFRHIALMKLVTEMYSLQGKCERIKNTPFPRQYAYFSNVFTWIFIALMPFAIVGEIASHGELIWLNVPISVLISWVFYTMESVGDTSEDPFENFMNDVPMTALCRTIEIDVRQMMSEGDVPDPLVPVDDILM
tara:strand:- start:313099 stop:314079 length:981 start_codon:yes stop_codon:yes gene_type:complete